MIMQYICLARSWKFIFKKEKENICLGEVDLFAQQYRHFLGSFWHNKSQHSKLIFGQIKSS